MNEIIRINGHDLSVKEYNGKRVVTFKEIDTVHERPNGTARKRFNDNRKHFIEGEDYFVRKTDEAYKAFGITAPNGLTLITESGYYMLVKSFTDNLSWDVQRELVNNYFNVAKPTVTEIKKYQPTRPLTTDDYEEAAKTIAKCHNSRLSIVIDLYKKAGLDIEIITETQKKLIQEDECDAREFVELLNQYTLTQLCELLSICKSSLYYYMSGKVKPHPKRMKKIIQMLREQETT